MLTPLRPRPNCVTRAPDSAPRKISPLHHLTVTRGFRADISPAQMPRSTPGCCSSAEPPPQLRGLPVTNCLGPEGTSANGAEPGDVWRRSSLTVQGAPRGRSGRVHRGSSRGGRGGCGGSTPSTRKDPRAATATAPAAARLTGTPPTPAHWPAEGVGRGRFRPISGRQRTANRRCATVSCARGPRLRQASPHPPTARRVLAMKAARPPAVARGQCGPERGEGRRSV